MDAFILIWARTTGHSSTGNLTESFWQIHADQPETDNHSIPGMQIRSPGIRRHGCVAPYRPSDVKPALSANDTIAH